MENNILDEVESENYPRYGNKAYGYFLKALLSFLCLFIIPMFLGEKLTLGLYQMVDVICILMVFVFSILGWRNINKSIKLEERTTSKITCAEIGIYLLLGIFAMPIIWLVFLFCSSFF